MARIINVAYAGANNANNKIWQDASFKTIGDVIPSFTTFDISNISVNNMNMRIAKIESSRSAVKRIINPNGLKYDVSSSNVGSNILLNVENALLDSGYEHNATDIGIWNVEFKCARPMSQNSLMDKDAIKNSIKNLFTFNVGERILLPTYGNVLDRLVGSKCTDGQMVAIKESIKNMLGWESRIVVNDIEINYEADENLIRIGISYSIPAIKVTEDNIEFLVNVKDE